MTRVYVVQQRYLILHDARSGRGQMLACGRSVVYLVAGIRYHIRNTHRKSNSRGVGITCVVHREPVARYAFPVAVLVSKARTESGNRNGHQQQGNGGGRKQNLDISCWSSRVSLDYEPYHVLLAVLRSQPVVMYLPHETRVCPLRP